MFLCLFSGHDMLSLIFHLLDEFLFVFSAEPFFIARVSYNNYLGIKKYGH